MTAIVMFHLDHKLVKDSLLHAADVQMKNFKGKTFQNSYDPCNLTRNSLGNDFQDHI